MTAEESLSFIPHELRTLPWMQQILELIQRQTEEIIALKKTVQEQKDEIDRLKKMPKRPKFRQGRGDPKSRSGNPSNPKVQGGPGNDMVPKKMRQEVRVQVENVPMGSRFKGYQDYAVQELEITPKDVIYRLEVWQAPEAL